MAWLGLLVFSGIMACIGPVTSASCPIELSPPIAVVGYGGPMSVNCSTSAEHEGMGWEASVGIGIGLQADVSQVTWTVESLTDWDIAPKCFINHLLPSGDSDQCKETLPVVLYKMPDSVSISGDIGPLVEYDGYKLHCDIVHVAPLRNLSVTWYQGNTIIKTHLYKDSLIKTPVNESFHFEFTPRRGDNGAHVFCEAVLDLGPFGPNLQRRTSKPLELTVQYLPTFIKPETEVLGIESGVTLNLNCTAVGNPMPVYSWQFPHPMTEKMENQAVWISSKLLPGTYNCSASNILGTSTKQFVIKQNSRNRTTFAAILGVSLALGVLLFVAGVIFLNHKGKLSRACPPGGRSEVNQVL